jgi:phage shock protein PspC (stress-responsive transcriptional regulator)
MCIAASIASAALQYRTCSIRCKFPTDGQRGVVRFPKAPAAAAVLRWKNSIFWFGTPLAQSHMQDLPTEFQMDAQEKDVALPLRSHTILGVCEAIGEDFGFNPIFLRIPLAASVIWNPLIAIGTYFVLGIAVLASRLLFPKATPQKAEAVHEQQPANEQRELAKAA